MNEEKHAKKRHTLKIICICLRVCAYGSVWLLMTYTFLHNQPTDIKNLKKKAEEIIWFFVWPLFVIFIRFYLKEIDEWLFLVFFYSRWHSASSAATISYVSSSSSFERVWRPQIPSTLHNGGRRVHFFGFQSQNQNLFKGWVLFPFYFYTNILFIISTHNHGCQAIWRFLF